MALADNLNNEVGQILTQSWDKRNAVSLPTTDNVALSGGMANIEAAFLYADLAHSSQLATDFHRNTASKLIKSYLYGMGKLIKHNEGNIVSFDGDRVMGVFLGKSKNTNAVKCGLQMNNFVSKILKPKLKNHFTSLRNSGFEITHGCGIDSGQISAIRAGVRGDNDLVWIGRASNLAAKLSDIREGSYRTFISEAVYNSMNKSKRVSSDGRNMWKADSYSFNGEKITVYKSSWTWKL